MRATIFTPTAIKRNYVEADSQDVEFDNLESLLTGLEPVDELRVVVHRRGSTHYVYRNKQWQTALRIIKDD